MRKNILASAIILAALSIMFLFGQNIMYGQTTAVNGWGGGSTTGATTAASNTFSAGPQTVQTGSPNNIGAVIQGTNAPTGTPALVQSTQYTVGNPANSKSLAFSSPVTSGDMVLVVVQQYSLNSGPSTPTDTLGSTYTLVKSAASSYSLWVYSAPLTTGGSDTISLNCNACGLQIFEYNTILSTSTLDASASQTGTPTNPQVVGPITTTQKDLIFTAFADVSGNVTSASGFTTRLTGGSYGGGVLVTADEVVAAGTVSASWTTNAAGNYGAVVIAFKASSTGQVSDLIQYKNGYGTLLSGVNSLGQIYLPTSAGLPSNVPSAGTIGFNSTTLSPIFYTGSAWQNLPTQASARVLLAELTANNSAELDFTTRNAPNQSGALFQSDFDEYEVQVLEVIPATNSVPLWMQFSTNGGSSYDSSSANYEGASYSMETNVSGGGYGQQPSPNGIQWWGSDLSSSGGVSGYGNIVNPLGSVLTKRVIFDYYGENATGNWFGIRAFGRYKVTTAVNSLRFITSLGNIASGNIRIYGITK